MTRAPPRLDDRCMDATRTDTSRDAWLELLVPLLWVAWLLVPAWLVLGAAITMAPFLGEASGAGEQAAARRSLALAAVLVVALPALGLAVSRRLVRPVAAWSFGAALAVGLVGAAVGVGSSSLGDPQVPATPRSGTCQEHSGAGGIECPGG